MELRILFEKPLISQEPLTNPFCIVQTIDPEDYLWRTQGSSDPCDPVPYLCAFGDRLEVVNRDTERKYADSDPAPIIDYVTELPIYFQAENPLTTVEKM